MKNKKKDTGLKGKAAAYVRGTRLGIDRWSAALWAMFVPVLVWAFYSPRADLIRYANVHALYVSSFVFEGIALAMLLFLVREEDSRPDFLSIPVVLAVLGTVMSVVAWIFYLCAYVNWGVMLFLTVFPALALACCAVARKNWYALLPVALFLALSLSGMIATLIWNL